jgi:hypothetical protein
MNISPKYIVTGVVFFTAFFAYNAFLIQRDQRLYDAYYCKTIGCANER